MMPPLREFSVISAHSAFAALSLRAHTGLYSTDVRDSLSVY